MPGTPDELTEQQQTLDPVRPRESHSAGSDLQERMERLPPGHPSSPYNEDGSRKPPVPDPFQNDSPIPGDPDYQPDAPGESGADHPEDADNTGHPSGIDATDENPQHSQADHSLDAEDMPHISSDGSWEWRGFSLTAEQSRSGDNGVAKRREAEGRNMEGTYGEHGLTPAMRRVEAQLEHGKLAPDTERFALKSTDRFKLKLAERISVQPGESADVLAARIHDGIRYTFVYDDEHYTAGSQETETVLESGGYELITRKPSWDSPDYKGINSQWRDPDSGLLFEVQFHTYASWDAKQTTHPAYEGLSDLRTSPKERERLDSYQKEITASVPVPPGALEIPFYYKKGA